MRRRLLIFLCSSSRCARWLFQKYSENNENGNNLQGKERALAETRCSGEGLSRLIYVSKGNEMKAHRPRLKNREIKKEISISKAGAWRNVPDTTFKMYYKTSKPEKKIIIILIYERQPIISDDDARNCRSWGTRPSQRTPYQTVMKLYERALGK